MDDLKCVDCGTLPPETESAYTLIGGKAGWRLTRHRRSDGVVTAEWRCPDCWQKFKKATGGAVGTPGGAPPRAGTAPKHDSISPGGRRRGE
jgi:hypothetical protein